MFGEIMHMTVAQSHSVGALTHAERRVALHGHSNRQIAQTLFITTKTVETHLARAYRKLAITSRRQLGDALASPSAQLSTEDA
ncbi:helix-turn-helix transcriptional regulator [Amycolatopsis sp. NPDC058278]|uniref:helix-turn-helix domain-containing protein n=1 Tax=Amycolatopsis sp. NPDC058278 TaxID=3346417 RepID=UPI0036D93B28